MIQFVNKWSGEVYDLPDDTPDQIKDAWLALSETIKGCERAKDKLKPKVEALVDNKQNDFGDYKFVSYPVQRYTYDKGVLREVLDEDTFDVMLIPDKTKVDIYLKENIDTLGEAGTALRNSMVPVGNPYTVTKLEKN